MSFFIKTIFFILMIPPLLLHLEHAKADPVILIDPGHGGDDCGAQASTNITTKSLAKNTKSNVKSKKVCEKDIALSIAKKIHTLLTPHFKTYLTRSVDRNVSLEERANLAQKIKATLFISVHVNSSVDKKSHGFETFYLDNHNNIAVRKVEQVENRDAKGDEVVINQILTDLVIDRTAPESKVLAQFIHNQIVKDVKKKFNMTDRGIRPALFYVLALSKRPAVLLEPGFLSNPDEMNKILSLKFQNAYAQAVAQGIITFYKTRTKDNPILF